MSLPRLHRVVLSATAASALLMTAACGGESDPDEIAQPGSTAPADPGGTTDAGDSEESGDYADGTYEASGSYTNPGGTSSVSVELTLEGGTVTGLDFTPEASGTSRQYQNKFASGIVAEVVGKSIDDLDVSKVAGSSLTAGGFNQAIEAIKADARA